MTAGSSTSTTNGKNNHRPVMAMMGGVAVQRIRTPNQEDVLCGRGGGINSHPGNRVFRAWVTERKSDYNLAPNKQEKTQVAMEVVWRIQNQSPRPGRFLRKDPSIQGGQTWWVVCEESKALAKTTQALREGAPRIRQAHENATGNTGRAGPAVAASASAASDAARSRPAKTNKKRKRKPAAASAKKPPPPSEDAAEKLVLQTVRQNASSLSSYKSEHLFLPATDYIAVAMNQLQENVEKAKQEASREPQRAEAHHQQKLPCEERNMPAREQQTPYYQERTVPAHAEAAPKRALVAPLTSNRAFDHIYGNRKDMVRTKKSKANPLASPAVDPFAETPPLTAAPEPDVADGIPVLSLDRVGLDRVFVGDAPTEPAQKRRPLKRENSLALSDSGWSNADGSDGCPFVNPFADESDILENGNNPTLAKLDVSSSEYHQVFKGDKSENQATGGETKNGTMAYSRSASTFGSSVNVLLNSILSLSSFVAPSNHSEPASRSGISKEGGDSTLEDQNNNLNNNTDYFFDDVQVGDDAGGSFSPFYHGIFGGKRHPSSSKT